MRLGALLIFLVIFMSHAGAQESSKNYQTLLNTYYLQDKEALISQDIVDVAQIIVNNRKEYRSDIVAKAFSLLSDVAFNRGDLVAALQFAQYGNSIEKISVKIKLDLLLKLARGYYSQGKYIQLQDVSEQAAWLAEQAGNVDYHLQAKAYLVVAYALNTDYSLAMTELSNLEQMLSRDNQDVEQIKLLEIVAEAHFYLAEYENAIELLNRVLKLRADMSKVKGLARTYHLLAEAYYQLHQYDDAYNAYWESMQFSSKFGLNIRASYAELGLGKVLYQQQNYAQAHVHLIKALTIFERYNLPRTILSTQITLVKTYYALNQPKLATQTLLMAEKLADKLVLTSQQLDLFLLLSNYYQEIAQYQKAVNIQQRYIQLYQGFNPSMSAKNTLTSMALKASNKTRVLALNLAEQSELSLQFNAKYYRQQLLITLLSIALACLGLLIIFWLLRRHQKQVNHGYDEIELSANHLARPIQTKRWYQQQYKMARKYRYNIALAYLVIENWQELTFHFNAKALAEVQQAIATIVNENLEEEDYSGEVSAGEYLFLCPHQDTEQAKTKLMRIEQAINTRFFANLGDYSVKIGFSVSSPNIQDIDPYVFLSRLSERNDAEFNEH